MKKVILLFIAVIATASMSFAQKNQAISNDIQRLVRINLYAKVMTVPTQLDTDHTSGKVIFYYFDTQSRSPQEITVDYTGIKSYYTHVDLTYVPANIYHRVGLELTTFHSSGIAMPIRWWTGKAMNEVHFQGYQTRYTCPIYEHHFYEIKREGIIANPDIHISLEK
jgi:hypothetical protein